MCVFSARVCAIRTMPFIKSDIAPHEAAHSSIQHKTYNTTTQHTLKHTDAHCVCVSHDIRTAHIPRRWLSVIISYTQLSTSSKYQRTPIQLLFASKRACRPLYADRSVYTLTHTLCDTRRCRILSGDERATPKTRDCALAP